MVSFRAYLIIAISVGAICAAVAYFDTGGSLASVFTSIGDTASPYVGGTIADFITQPIANAFSNIYWAIGAGILWPLLVIWFSLFLMLLGVSIIGPVLGGIEAGI